MKLLLLCLVVICGLDFDFGYVRYNEADLLVILDPLLNQKINKKYTYF